MQLETLPLISADSHVEEPTNLWFDELPASMREHLPPEMRPTGDSTEEFGERIGVQKDVRRGGLVVGDSTREITQADTADVEARYQVMREDGIVGECIYPTKALYVWNMDDADAGRACCDIYNRWIADRLESRSPRFRCAGLIPTWRIEEAMEGVRRVADLGLGALMLPLVGTPPYNHRDWEPLWSVIEETGLPVVMHQGSGHDMLFYRGRGASVSNLLATQSMAARTASLLATSGALADHPGLHVVFVECNAGWMSWAMNTVDYYYDAFQQYEGWVRPVLPEKPSFYMRRQLHGTFQVDPVAITNVVHTGAAVPMWGSDFPHAEGTYPHSRAVVNKLLAGFDLEQAADIAGRTAARLFDFEPEVLTTPV